MNRKYFVFFILFLSILTGCAISNKSVSNEFITNKSNSLSDIFSKMLYQNKTYPFIYQKYLIFKGSSDNKLYDEMSNFNNQLKLLCKSRGGKVMSVIEFDRKYKINKEDMLDRCFKEMPYFDMCIENNNSSIPRVLFVWNAGNKETHRYYADYVHRFREYNSLLGGYQNYAYINNIPSRIVVKEFNQVEEKVCLPDKEDWEYFFKSARKAYDSKRAEEEKKQKKKIEKQKLENSFRRF
jgi:hypothetical protein